MFWVTTLHIVDPKNPGAVDEIINLGEYWKEEGIRRFKNEILTLNKEVGRLFNKAYGYLAQARILLDEVETYYVDSKSLDITGLNALAKGLETLLLNYSKTKMTASERHIFASGITPDGPVNYLETIFSSLDQRYILRGPSGSGKATIVKKLFDAAICKGISVEAFHCSLRPEEIEHLVFPDLKIGVITGSTPHEYRAAPGDIILNTDEFVYFSKLRPHEEDIAEAGRRYDEAFNRAVSFINRAKQAHDELEKYYIPHMKFDRVDACRKRLVERIIAYSG